MRRYVLDANALLSFLGTRSGGAKVAALFSEAGRSEQPLLMSAVNWGEVVYTTWKLRGEGTIHELTHLLAGVPLLVMPVGEADAWDAALLKAVHKLPYADSFAAALAMRHRATLVTANRILERVGSQLPVVWLPEAGPS
jgi:predicted nucleic acid-binding protein